MHDDRELFHTVLRLNTITCPMIREEREILAGAEAEVVEIETLEAEGDDRWVSAADAILVASAHLDHVLIRRLKRCKVISRLGTGLDNIDVGQATQQGILVTNVSDFATDEVADHTMALLLASVRQLRCYEASARRGKRPHLTLPLVHRLSALTLGLIGYGSIGKAVARRAAGFGMKILAYDKFQEVEPSFGVVGAELETLLRQSDIVSLHCPLTDETRHLLTIVELEKMKSTAILINTSRGHVVDETDLVLALESGVISYAALDVFGQVNLFNANGFPMDHPLWHLPNVLITPHCAAHSAEALLKGRTEAAQSVADVLGGRWPKRVANPQVVPWFPLDLDTADGSVPTSAATTPVAQSRPTAE